LLALKFKIKKNDANLKFKKILDLLTNDNEIKIIGVVDD
jgi:translation initiation factor IF-3